MARNGDESDEETPEKDKDYDALNEKDQGEPEDIANDEYLRRIDEFEELADAAALLGVDANHPTEGSSSKKGKGRGRGSGKARGPTKGLGKTGPMFLQFDSLLRPSGKWRLKYGQQIAALHHYITASLHCCPAVHCTACSRTAVQCTVGQQCSAATGQQCSAATGQQCSEAHVRKTDQVVQQPMH
ncbi:hypothetical protein SOVF_139610 [Spinacia oleracea]|nr:hypothetical protein SOVF_139610 [Spinacia oleracea]